MNEVWLLASGWLLRMAVGGGLLLLLTWLVVRRLRQPARQQRLAEFGVAAALVLAVLCLIPSWLVVPLPARTQPRESKVSTAPPAEVQPREEMLPPHAGEEDAARVPLPAEVAPVEVVPPPAPPERARLSPAKPAALPPVTDRLAAGLVCLYLAGVVYFLGRLVRGYGRLVRCLRAARPAPARVRLLYRGMIPERRPPRLLVSDRVPVPLSCGLLRPTVLLPTSLCEPEAEGQLRWALAHELAHLRRLDAAGCLLFGLGQAIYYFVPWFWTLRRQARLCREYVADAAAVGEGGAVDYAEFLLGWSAAPAVPAGATGVSGHSSDLFRRISMLVNNPLRVEERCPRRWSFLAAAGLLAVAVLGAGVGLKAVAAPAPHAEADKDKNVEKKEKPKAEEKKPRAELPQAFPRVEDLLKQFPAWMDERQRKQIEAQLKMSRRMLEQLQRQMPNGNLPAFPNGGLLPQFPRFPNLDNLNRFNRLNRLNRFNFNRRDQQPQHDPRLGARVQKPSSTLIDQLDLPRGQGVVIEDVLNGSAAAKAGLKPHDILLELNGKPVPSDPADFSRLLQDVKADTRIDAVVMRKTRKETIKGLSLPKAPEVVQPGFNNRRLNVPRGRAIGRASTSITRTNDSFRARYQQDGIAITVTGKLVEGRAQAREIQVQDEGKTVKYDSVDKIPAQHQATVKRLLRSVSGGQGRRRIRIN